MKKNIPTIILFALAWICSSFKAQEGAEKVDVYYSHFLLQSWPENKRTLNIDVDTSLPPDTIVFKATGLKGGLTQTTLQIQNMLGTTIDQVTRISITSDGKEAVFMYPLTTANLRKLNAVNFKILLDNHQFNTPEIHTIAVVVITKT